MRWGTQLERGYSTLIVAEIEGIPVRWVERAVATAADDTAPASTSGTTTDPSLVIPMGMTQAVDIDRQTGIANGRAMDVILDLDQMGDTARALFVRPSLKTILTADVTNPAATTIAVASTTGFAASGGFWLGREHITYTSVTATTFVGCTRGVSAATRGSTFPTARAAIRSRPTRRCTGEGATSRCASIWSRRTAGWSAPDGLTRTTAASFGAATSTPSRKCKRG
jgi:hypothetical protein